MPSIARRGHRVGPERGGTTDVGGAPATATKEAGGTMVVPDIEHSIFGSTPQQFAAMFEQEYSEIYFEDIPLTLRSKDGSKIKLKPGVFVTTTDSKGEPIQQCLIDRGIIINILLMDAVQPDGTQIERSFPNVEGRKTLLTLAGFCSEKDHMPTITIGSAAHNRLKQAIQQYRQERSGQHP